MYVHSFLGLGWDEWASVVTIIGAFSGVVWLLLRTVVGKLTSGIMDSFRSLKFTMEKLNDTMKRSNADINELRDEYEKLDQTTNSHETRISLLEKEREK